MFWAVGVSFVVAFLTKLTDDLNDKKHSFSPKLKYLTALAYGLAGGYLISLNSLTAALGLAIVFGVLIFQKIDQAHQLALAGIILAVAFLGLPALNLPLAGGLAVFALLDEWLDEKAEKNKKLSKLGKRLLQERLSLPLACLAFGLLWQDFTLFFLILAFNLGYDLAGSQFSALLKLK